jgi:hypothetical protein
MPADRIPEFVSELLAARDLAKCESTPNLSGQTAARFLCVGQRPGRAKNF